MPSKDAILNSGGSSGSEYGMRLATNTLSASADTIASARFNNEVLVAGINIQGSVLVEMATLEPMVGENIILIGISLENLTTTVGVVSAEINIDGKIQNVIGISGNTSSVNLFGSTGNTSTFLINSTKDVLVKEYCTVSASKTTAGASARVRFTYARIRA